MNERAVRHRRVRTESITAQYSLWIDVGLEVQSVFVVVIVQTHLRVVYSV